MLWACLARFTKPRSCSLHWGPHRFRLFTVTRTQRLACPSSSLSAQAPRPPHKFPLSGLLPVARMASTSWTGNLPELHPSPDSCSEWPTRIPSGLLENSMWMYHRPWNTFPKTKSITSSWSPFPPISSPWKSYQLLLGSRPTSYQSPVLRMTVGQKRTQNKEKLNKATIEHAAK